MKSRQQPYRFVSFGFLLALTLLGCGDNNGRVPVTGMIKFDGEPLKTGFISFIGEQGYAVASGPVDNGSFRLDESPSQSGIAPGQYQVVIESWTEEPGKMLPDGKFSTGKSAIPEKYNHPEKSGVTAEVTPSQYSFDFELTSK